MTQTAQKIRDIFRPDYPDDGTRGTYSELLENLDGDTLRVAESYYISLGLMTEGQRIVLHAESEGGKDSSTSNWE